MQEAREREWIEFDAWIGKEIDRIRRRVLDGASIQEAAQQPQLGSQLLRLSTRNLELVQVLLAVKSNPDLIDGFVEAILSGDPTTRRGRDDIPPTREWALFAIPLFREAWDRRIRTFYALDSAFKPNGGA